MTNPCASLPGAVPSLCQTDEMWQVALCDATSGSSLERTLRFFATHFDSFIMHGRVFLHASLDFLFLHFSMFNTTVLLPLCTLHRINMVRVYCLCSGSDLNRGPVTLMDLLFTGTGSVMLCSIVSRWCRVIISPGDVGHGSTGTIVGSHLIEVLPRWQLF